MTKIKICGLSRSCDIAAVNALAPDYAGFVFAPQSKRYITPAAAAELKAQLSPAIAAVGVFVDENIQSVAQLLSDGVIDIAQLHGDEDEEFVLRLKALTGKPVIKAFLIGSAEDVARARQSAADYVLLDSGAGGGKQFDWSLLRGAGRPYFLAGGLSPANVRGAIRTFRPFAVDVSSGVETDGFKDKSKMAAFVAAVRQEDLL